MSGSVGVAAIAALPPVLATVLAFIQTQRSASGHHAANAAAIQQLRAEQGAALEDIRAAVERLDGNVAELQTTTTDLALRVGSLEERARRGLRRTTRRP